MSCQILMPDSVQGQQGQSSVLKLCPRHRNKECIYLSTDPARTDDLVFKCEFCVVEQTLQSKYLLPISQLAASDLKTVFWHWPLPNNAELLEKVRELSTREKPDAAYKQRIDKFFKEMRMEINAKIDEVQAAMKTRAQTLWDFDHTILEQYSQLSAKEALKSAVLDSSEEIEQLSMRIRRTVTGVLSDTEVTAASLASSLDQLALQESAVDFEGPPKLKEEILERISRICMFLVEDMQDLQAQPVQLREMEAQAEGNLDVVLRLASCRFNDLSQGFKERLSNQLQKFRRVFDRIELGDAREESKRVVEFERLDEEEVAEVKAFAQRLIEAKKKRERGENGNTLKVEDLVGLLRNKANHASEEMLEKSQALLDGVKRYVGTFEVEQIHKDGFVMEQFEGMSDSEIKVAGKAIQGMKELLGEGEQQREALEEVVNIGKQIASSIRLQRQPDAKSLSSDKVIELVKNDTNFCSEEYVRILNAALKGVKWYLESFELTERENKGLEREQLSSLGMLGSKIKDLNERYGDSLKGRESPSQQEQPNSWRVSSYLSHYIEFNGLKELDRLFCKLPVLELTECQWKQMPSNSIQWKWMKAGLWESSTLQLQNENNGVRITRTNQCNSQAVTESTLDNNLVYSVKCSFNKPLNGASYIMVGLIPEDKINTNYFGEDHDSCFYSYLGYGPKEIIKGQLLNSDAMKNTLTTILFKFCIKTQTFLQSDPTLQNISKLDKAKINPNIKYRFGIQFQNNASGYSCLFSDVMSCLDQASAENF